MAVSPVPSPRGERGSVASKNSRISSAGRFVTSSLGDLVVPVAREVAGVGLLDEAAADQRDDAAVGLAADQAAGRLDDARHARLQVGVVEARLLALVEVPAQELPLEGDLRQRRRDDEDARESSPG